VDPSRGRAKHFSNPSWRRAAALPTSSPIASEEVCASNEGRTMAERKSAERSRRSVREGLGGRERLSRIGCVQTTKSELCRHKVNPYPGGRTRLSVSPEELPRSILLQAKGTSRTPTVPMQSSRGGTTRPRPVRLAGVQTVHRLHVPPRLFTVLFVFLDPASSAS